MSRERCSISVRVVNGKKWGDLNAMAESHQIVAESCKVVDQAFSFAGGHRVRLLRLKKNVHFLIPQGTQLDISQVPPAAAPRRQGRPQR